MSHSMRERGSERPYSTSSGYDDPPVFAALDLGTNNCRLMVAKCEHQRLRIIDSFSQIVRLGEGVAQTGELSEGAMERTLSALKQCAQKLAYHPVKDRHFVATEACRRASNGPAFIERVYKETGIRLNVIGQKDEAVLAFLGCSPLLESETDFAIMLDIGGGSTEIMFVDVRDMFAPRIVGWQSFPVGVMNVSESMDGAVVDDASYAALVEKLRTTFHGFSQKPDIAKILQQEDVQMICCSGTVTTVTALYKKLPRYERREVDGFTLPCSDMIAVIQGLLASSHQERAANPCIGQERADFLVPGCGILQAACEAIGISHITVADRGVREGILQSLFQKHVR